MVKENAMNSIFKVCARLAACGAGLFAASIVVYMFNLDMRLIARVQPLLEPIYDRIERSPMP